MKKVIYSIVVIQYLIFSVQSACAQAPISTPDNVGAGNCLSFDGVNDVVIVNNFDIDQFAELTMEGWFNIENTATGLNQHIFGNDNGGFDRALSVINSTLYAFVGNDAINTGILISENTWYHTAITYSATDVVVHLNGAEMWNYGSPTAAFDGGNLYIGASEYNGGTHYFDGKIDDVRVWNRVQNGTRVVFLLLSRFCFYLNQLILRGLHEKVHLHVWFDKCHFGSQTKFLPEIPFAEVFVLFPSPLTSTMMEV